MSNDVWGGISSAQPEEVEEQSPVAESSPVAETRTSTSVILGAFNVQRDSKLLPNTPVIKSSSMEKIYEMTGTGGGERDLLHRENPHPGRVKGSGSSGIISDKPPRPLMEQRVPKSERGSDDFPPPNRPSTNLLPIVR
jgi:hypothetical protein